MPRTYKIHKTAYCWNGLLHTAVIAHCALQVEEALAKYSEAARLNPGDATFLSNR